MKSHIIALIAMLTLAHAVTMQAAQLSTNAHTAIPHDVQQLLVVDYKAIQNSTGAMSLRGPCHAC